MLLSYMNTFKGDVTDACCAHSVEWINSSAKYPVSVSRNFMERRYILLLSLAKGITFKYRSPLLVYPPLGNSAQKSCVERGWGDGSVGKSACCFSRGPAF